MNLLQKLLFYARFTHGLHFSAQSEITMNNNNVSVQGSTCSFYCYFL